MTRNKSGTYTGKGNEGVVKYWSWKGRDIITCKYACVLCRDHDSTARDIGVHRLHKQNKKNVCFFVTRQATLFFFHIAAQNDQIYKYMYIRFVGGGGVHAFRSSYPPSSYNKVARVQKALISQLRTIDDTRALATISIRKVVWVGMVWKEIPRAERVSRLDPNQNRSGFHLHERAAVHNADRIFVVMTAASDEEFGGRRGKVEGKVEGGEGGKWGKS